MGRRRDNSIKSPVEYNESKLIMAPVRLVTQFPRGRIWGLDKHVQRKHEKRRNLEHLQMHYLNDGPSRKEGMKLVFVRERENRRVTSEGFSEIKAQFCGGTWVCKIAVGEIVAGKLSILIYDLNKKWSRICW